MPSYLAPTDPFEGITASDNRYVAYDPVPPAVNPMPFMSLGRLPADSLADAQAMISKIVGYEINPIASGWNSRAVFVADDPDLAGNFPASSDVIANSTYTLLVLSLSKHR
jgi:hypothetical protein